MKYRCPDHLMGMSTFPENAEPPAITVLAGGLLAVGWGAPARCAACNDLASAQVKGTMAFPPYAPEIYPGATDQRRLARDPELYDYGRLPYYIPTVRFVTEESTSPVPSDAEDRS